MVYRSRMEIQANILEAARRGASKTRVMYNATLSHFQLSSYLKDLVETGLIEYDGIIRLYRTTSKGFDFLNSFKLLSGLLDHGASAEQALSELDGPAHRGPDIDSPMQRVY